jgi:hypothetical protein
MHVETSKMQKHLDVVEIERRNYIHEHWGALEEHCDVIKLDIWK